MPLLKIAHNAQRTLQVFSDFWHRELLDHLYLALIRFDFQCVHKGSIELDDGGALEFLTA